MSALPLGLVNSGVAFMINEGCIYEKYLSKGLVVVVVVVRPFALLGHVFRCGVRQFFELAPTKTSVHVRTPSVGRGDGTGTSSKRSMAARLTVFATGKVAVVTAAVRRVERHRSW